jgi:hypothetical protein
LKRAQELEEQKKNKTSKPRSDKGSSHKYPMYRNTFMLASKLSVYNRICARIDNRANQQIKETGTSLLSKEFDVNYFYRPIPETKAHKATNYKQIYKGRPMQHTVATVVTQKYIDIEKYRFEALQQQAEQFPDESVPKSNKDLKGLLINRYCYTIDKVNELLDKGIITWKDFFCELYFIKPSQLSFWDYKDWQAEYSKIPPETDLIDINFQEERFDIWETVLDRHPEWKYYVQKKEQQEELDKEIEQQRRREQYKNHFKKGG